MLMPSFNERLGAFNEAERLRPKLTETQRKQAKVQSHYSRLKAMYATLKGETKKPTKMQAQVISLLESGVTDLHIITERVGCTYGYVKNISMHYRRLTNGR